MHLFRGIDFLPPFFPSLLDALEVGSFVSLVGLCWSRLVRRVVWVPEPNIRYLSPDCPAHWLCDFQDSPYPLWASWSFSCPVLVVRGSACWFSAIVIVSDWPLFRGLVLQVALETCTAVMDHR